MADKSITIKGATDKELDDLIIRLRKENEAQDLVSYLKRKSSPNSVVSYDRPEVSTEQPIESLYHFGILGMKWGRRKSGVGKAHPHQNGHSQNSEDHEKKINLRKKHIREMSNAELRELTVRMQLEKQYKDLKRGDISSGKKFVDDIIKDIGKEMMKEALRSGIKAGAKNLKGFAK